MKRPRIGGNGDGRAGPVDGLHYTSFPYLYVYTPLRTYMGSGWVGYATHRGYGILLPDDILAGLRA